MTVWSLEQWWTLKIDWDDDGNFGHPDDNITGDVCDKAPITWELGMRPFEHIADESVLQFTVWNEDRKYSPENTGSPLYGKLRPGLAARLMYANTVMWQGFTADFKPAPLRYGKRTTAVECRGIKSQLETFELYAALYENVTADTIIGDLATTLIIPPAASGLWLLGVQGYGELGYGTFLGDITDVALLDSGKHVFAYVGDNSQNDGSLNAYGLFKDLAETERGYIFVNRAGKLVFWNRHHLLNDVTVDVTLDNTAEDIDYATPLEDLINYIEVECFPRQVSDVTTDLLWELGQPVTIPAGTSQTIQTPFIDTTTKQKIGAKNVQTPSGADLVFSSGTGSVSKVDTGQRSEVTIANTGSTTAVLDTLNVRGRSITSNYPAQVYSQDAASVARYGKHALKLALKLLDDVTEAQSIALFELVQRNSAAGRAKSVKLKDRPNPTHDQITRTIGDLVRVVDYQLAHDRNYHIISERHRLDVANDILETEWLLLPRPTVDFWILGEASFGELGTETVLGY